MHKSVLLQEAIKALSPECGEIYLDATLGSGGHAVSVCRQLEGDVTIVGIDADADALARSQSSLAEAGCTNAHLVRENFRNLDTVLDTLGIQSVDMALFDLGISSNQLAAPHEGGAGRGFSFTHDEPLIMTLDSELKDGALTAEVIVNEWPEEELATIIRHYGGERYARRIAGAIVASRQSERIVSTGMLADVVKEAVPRGYERGRIHPATRTFQAIRMAVNDEWEALKEGLAKAFARLAPDGRLAVITFHSIEDRVVKRFMRESVRSQSGSFIVKKPVIPSDEEVQNNPRARSAKLRAVKKITSQYD